MTRKSKTHRQDEQIDWVGTAPARGRPRLHPDAKAAQAAASRAYRARKRAEKAAIDARKTRPIESDTIALDHIPPWRR